MKRLLSWLLALVMIISCLPMSVLPAFAAEEAPEVEGTSTTDPNFNVDFWELLPGGSVENPYTPEWVWNETNTEATATVTIPAGKTMYLQSYGVGGMIMTINGGEGVTCTGNPRTAYAWTITNDTEADADYVMVVSYPVGSMENPAQLIIDSYNDAVIEAGNTQGYYYTWTATGTGTLTIDMPDDMGWMYTINNLTSYVYGEAQYSDAETVADPATIEVTEGDEVQVVVNTYNPEDQWNNPGGTLSIWATFTYPLGSEQNPIFLFAEGQTETVTVPAGQTLYYQAYINGMNLTINDGEPQLITTANPRMPYIFSLTGGETDTEYTLSIAYPVGAMENPAQLVIGDNTSTHAEGSQGWYYTWTATEDGTLSITMPSDIGWAYVINNMTSYAYGDTQWSDSDPVVNPGTIEVAAGDEIQIMVNTYDAANPWTAPAGTLIITAAFEAAEPEVDLSQYMITFASMDLSTEAEIQFRYWLTIPEEVLNDDESYILLTKDGFAGEVEYKYTMAELRESGTMIGSSYIVCAGIASPEMLRGITLEAFYNGDQNYHFCNSKGVDKGTSFTYSALDYAKIALSTGTDDQKNLIANILTYGGYAQKFFNVDADSPVYDVLADYGITLPDVTAVTSDLFEDYKATASGTGATFSNFENVLDSAVYQRVDFTLDSGVSVDDCTFTLTGIDLYGESFTLDLEPTLVSGNTYRVLVEDIPACYWDQMYSVTVTNNSTGNSYVATTSILGYCRQVVRKASSNDANLVALCQAIYLYNQAANAFYSK